MVEAQAPRCTDGERRQLRSPRVAYAATVREHAVPVRRPRGARLASFGKRNVNGVPTVFGVLEAVVDAACKPQWYRVQLPLRPNGITGFVRAHDVTVARSAHASSSTSPPGA